MGTKLNHEQKGILDDQLLALRSKTADGIREFGYVREGLQLIIDGQLKLPGMNSALPSCFQVSPEELLERQRQINTDYKRGLEASAFKPYKGDFVPSSPTAFLLPGATYSENVGRDFELHAEVIQHQFQQPGRSFYRWDGLKSTSRFLRLAPGIDRRAPGIYWYEFDPFAHWDHQNGHCVSDLWEAKVLNLAASVILDGIMTLPNWVPSMDGVKVPYINLAGYQFRLDTDWSRVPFVRRWPVGHQLGLYVRTASALNQRWASPSARELVQN